MKTRRRRSKNMKGCGIKGCKKTSGSHTRHMKGGCGTCSQSGGNVIYAPVSSIATTVLSAGMNVLRTFQGLIPIL
jgi:hypothetical protein